MSNTVGAVLLLVYQLSAPPWIVQDTATFERMTDCATTAAVIASDYDLNPNQPKKLWGLICRKPEAINDGTENL